jgi:hypothetical protein
MRAFLIGLAGLSLLGCASRGPEARSGAGHTFAVDAHAITGPNVSLERTDDSIRGTLDGLAIDLAVEDAGNGASRFTGLVGAEPAVLMIQPNARTPHGPRSWSNMTLTGYVGGRVDLRITPTSFKGLAGCLGYDLASRDGVSYLSPEKHQDPIVIPRSLGERWGVAKGSAALVLLLSGGCRARPTELHIPPPYDANADLNARNYRLTIDRYNYRNGRDGP